VLCECFSRACKVHLFAIGGIAVGTMIFKKIDDIIPFQSLLKLLFSLSVIIQLAVISYSHFTGYYTVEGFFHLLSKLAMGTSLTLLAMLLIAYPDLLVIKSLNDFFPWNKRSLGRSVIQFSSAILLGVIISIGITLLSHFINTYEEPLREVLINNALIFSVANLMIMIILEAWIFFIEKAKEKSRSKALEKEIAQIRFEVLKEQINPHFMFNSLNVLSGLIESDQAKAQTFIDEFSHIYRYVLETIDQHLVTVEDELRFARSYMYLQQIRYGKYLHFSVDLPADLLKSYLPPLSLQVVLENAIKHNMVNQEQPLHINISDQEQQLFVTNNLQPKVVPVYTSGIGQKNLVKRFLLIGSQKPEFRLGTEKYEVLLPLIQEEKDEDFDYRR